MKRIQSWVNKLLSFWGRAQLIQCVLSNNQVYWCSLFILAQKLFKQVEVMLKNFLCSGIALRRSNAKVQWYLVVCSPISEEGLGFKPQCLGSEEAV